jgi:hypothetical protein
LLSRATLDTLLTNISKTTLWFTLVFALKSTVFIVLSIWIMLITNELPGSKVKLIIPIENNLGSLTKMSNLLPN